MVEALDPVCGMKVDSGSAPSVRHGGTDYYFCCEGCRSTFAANPGKYAGGVSAVGAHDAQTSHTSDAPAPTRYEGTMHLLPVVEGNRTFIEWKVQLKTAPQDADRWQTLFQSWIPDWTHSLERALARPHA